MLILGRSDQVLDGVQLLYMCTCAIEVYELKGGYNGDEVVRSLMHTPGVALSLLVRVGRRGSLKAWNSRTRGQF